MKHAALLTALLLLPALPAAAEMPLGCFARDYSAEHLAKNPNQHIAALRLNFTRQPGAKEISVDVIGRYGDQGRAKLDRVSGKVFTQLAFCDSKHCQVECDGGSFTVTSLKGDTLTIRTSYFVLEGGAGGCEGNSDLAELGGGETTYRLTRAVASACKGAD